jgi:transposase
MGAVTLSDKQQRRVQVLDRLDTGTMVVSEAARLLGVSERQVRRLREAYMQFGIPGMVHGNTGRSPGNRTPSSVVEETLRLCGKEGPYHDFNACFAQETLWERHGISLGRSTLDRLLREEAPRPHKLKRRSGKRCHRERSAAAGMMIQIDGSPHDWLEGRGPRLCLMGAIDDATKTLVYGRFHPTEDQRGYLMLLRGVCTKYGVPMSVYHDKHTILRSPKTPTLEEELAGVKPMSQVQRVMDNLGTEAIAAHSPQAKGRVERLWRTLQDRLIKEMRLAGVNTLEEANAFLQPFIERYNRRFTVLPRDAEPDWIPLELDADLDLLFSTRELRKVANDHTISIGGITHLILRAKPERSLAGKRVAVHVTPEGETVLYDGQTQLQHRVCAEPIPIAAVSVIPNVPDVVRLALEHRSNSFNPHRQGAPLSQQPPTVRASP